MIDLKAQREWAQKWADKGYVSIGVDPKALEALICLLEAAQKDQARYQWLRSNKFFIYPEHQFGPSHPVLGEFSFDIWSENPGSHNREGLDSAIDAAMAATKGEEA